MPQSYLDRREVYKVINLRTSGPCLQQAQALFWHQDCATKFPWQVCAGSTLGLSADSFIGWQGILSGGGSTLCHGVYIHCIILQLFAIVTSSCSLAGFSLVILELYDQGMVVFCLCYMIKIPSI